MRDIERLALVREQVGRASIAIINYAHGDESAMSATEFNLTFMLRMYDEAMCAIRAITEAATTGYEEAFRQAIENVRVVCAKGNAPQVERRVKDEPWRIPGIPRIPRRRSDWARERKEGVTP